MNVKIQSEMGALHTPVYDQFQNVLNVPGEPQRISSAKKHCRRAVLYGQKTARTNNAEDVWVGPLEGDQCIKVAPGGEVMIEAPVGCKLDLNQWWMVGDGNLDGLIIIYDSN